jgi:hypothetical protein
MCKVPRCPENGAESRLSALAANHVNGRRGRGFPGGEGGIRTHGRIAPTPVFKTGAFNRSATSPSGYCALAVAGHVNWRVFRQSGTNEFNRQARLLRYWTFCSSGRDPNWLLLRSSASDFSARWFLSRSAFQLLSSPLRAFQTGGNTIRLMARRYALLMLTTLLFVTFPSNGAESNFTSRARNHMFGRYVTCIIKVT